MTTTSSPDTDRHYSIAFICEVLGVPRRDWRLFARWAAGSMTPNALDALYSYVDVMIADRCRRRTDDLVSKLIELEADGEELTTDDIRRFVAALVTAAGR